jgi:quinol monooxygenase YgiN
MTVILSDATLSHNPALRYIAPALATHGETGINKDKNMVIVIGNVTVREDTLEQALTLARAHVERSRTEPGCISHAVHIDTENPNHLVFLEQWQDMDALQQHFRVPESASFVSALGELALEPPTLKLYTADEVPRH